MSPEAFVPLAFMNAHASVRGLGHEAPRGDLRKSLGQDSGPEYWSSVSPRAGFFRP